MKETNRIASNWSQRVEVPCSTALHRWKGLCTSSYEVPHSSQGDALLFPGCFFRPCFRSTKDKNAINRPASDSCFWWWAHRLQVTLAKVDFSQGNWVCWRIIRARWFSWPDWDSINGSSPNEDRGCVGCNQIISAVSGIHISASRHRYYYNERSKWKKSYSNEEWVAWPDGQGQNTVAILVIVL